MLLSLEVKDGAAVTGAVDVDASIGDLDTAFFKGESATDGLLDKLCWIARFGGCVIGPAPAENEERATDGPERLSGLKMPSLRLAVDELNEPLPKSDSGLVLTGDS